MAAVDAPDRRWVDEHTDAWVDAGLISPDEASAIRQFEIASAADVVPPRLGLMAEVAAYLGSVLALMGGTVVVGSRWDELAFVTRLALALAIALVGLGAGAWLMSFDEPGSTRLGGFLRVLGTAGVGLAVGVALFELDVDGHGAGITIGATVAVVGALLWRNRDRPLQLVTTVVGTGIVIGTVLDLTGWPVWAAGLAVGVAGWALFALVAAGWVRPRLVGLLTGYAVAMLGASMLGDASEHLGPGVAAATAATVVIAGLGWRSSPLLIAGVLGFLFAVQALLQTTFTGVASSGIVTLIGLVVVAVAITRARGRGPTHTDGGAWRVDATSRGRATR